MASVNGSETILNTVGDFNYFDWAGSGASEARYTEPTAGVFEAVPGGVLFRANRYRGGGTIISKATYYLPGGSAEFVWSGGGGNSFMQPVCGAFTKSWPTEPGNADASMVIATYGNSWNGSWVAAPGQVYRTTVSFTINSYTASTTDYLTNQYMGGSSGSFDFTKSVHLYLRTGDTFDYQNAYLELKSLKINGEIVTPTPIVPPHFTQGSGAAWANDRLLGSSSPSNTISQYGCFIASTSIILNSYGHNTDPGKLNQFLSQLIPSDYGILALGSIPASDSYGQTDGTKGIPVAFHSLNFPQTYSKAQIISTLASRITESGPVLLRVPQYKDGLEHFPAWTHAIVAWRVEGDQIFIRNPGSSRSGIASDRDIDSLTLNDYVAYVNGSVGTLSFRLDSDYQFLVGRMYSYAKAITNNTAFTARGAVHSPIEFVITDPLGRRVGYNPVSIQTFQEIPASLYERTSFIITPEGELMPNAGTHAPIDFEIGTLVEGTYTLDIFGIDTGEWSFNLGVNDASGFNPKQISSSGIASNTTHEQFTFQITKPSLALRDVIVSPPAQGQPPAITGKILGGAANGLVHLQASTDLGKTDPWTTLGAIQLNEFGNGAFTNVKDVRPTATNASSDFFRIMHNP